MIGVREALDCVVSALTRLGAERVALPQASGRVLAEAVPAARDIPPFRNAAMDGYAVRATDVAAATPEHPARLRVLETVGAGAVPQHTLTPGTAIKIMTGALLPDGADAVVRVEDTTEDGSAVAVRRAVAPGAAVREPGEDVRRGECVVPAGRPLRPADIGLLASVGTTMVSVSRRPRVALLATGDELVELGGDLRPGQIVNSNAYTLAAAVTEVGAEPLVLGIVRDEPARIRAAFGDAFAADVVLSTGGVSVGSFDYVREILRELGCEERFWKVAQKPGKPLTFSLRGRVPVFGLPGNPVSALVCFYVYVVPALRVMLGLDAIYLPSVEATMAEPVPKAAGLTEFIRCTLEGPPERYRARSTGSQSSGVLRSLSLGHGLIIAPPELAQLEADRPVRVLKLATEAGTATPPF
jgi:molybdopterin molybdotransferase